MDYEDELLELLLVVLRHGLQVGRLLLAYRRARVKRLTLGGANCIEVEDVSRAFSPQARRNTETDVSATLN